MTESLEILWTTLVSTFSLGPLIELVTQGKYESLLIWDGMKTLLAPIIPISVVVELLIALKHKSFKPEAYKVTFLIYLLNRIIGRFFTIAGALFAIGLMSPYALFNVPLSWYGFVWGYVVFELAHVVAHYLAHKVRLLWCLHSTHHAPRHMNLTVSYSHFILEYPYSGFIKISICIIAGIPIPMLFAIMLIDGVWGHLIHVGEDFVKSGRLGFLEKVILTPSHHRAHHAKNPLYIDTNFGNLVPIWDRLLGTYQPARSDVPFEYGITRKVDTNSFFDVYVGEFRYLWKDLVAAPGVLNKLRYLFMPPGWRHEGEFKTASAIRREYLKSEGQHSG